MASKVYFTEVSPGETPEQHAEKALKIYRAAGFDKQVGKDQLIGIKQHFGEKGGSGYLKAPIARGFATAIAKAGGKPFATDSSTLYKGQRANAIDHLNLCREHGFTIDTLGCPIIMADGLIGAGQVMVDVPGKHYRQVPIASAAYHADGFVVLTHVTGHIAAGYGASIKNVAMGLVSRAGKMSQHHGAMPNVNPEKCVLCKACEKWCPAEAIMVRTMPEIDRDRCIGCGECIAMCKTEALCFDWGEVPERLQEKMAEHCLGVHQLHPGKMCYFNFATNITRDCDCMGKQQKAECRDVGILASVDPVAVDQATVDLIGKSRGAELFGELRPEINPNVQTAHGEAIGLGSRQYELINV